MKNQNEKLTFKSRKNSHQTFSDLQKILNLKIDKNAIVKSKIFKRLKHLVNHDFISMANLQLILLFDFFLHFKTGIPFDNFKPSQVLEHVKRVESILKIGQSEGFTVKDEILTQGIVQFFFFILNKNEFVRILTCFNADNPLGKYELTHLHNFIFILLLKDVAFALSNPDLTQSEKDDLKLCRLSLLARITGGVRGVITRNRIGLSHKVYCGFDTEYETVENREVDLLCSTTSVFSRVSLDVKNLNLDFSITNHRDPRTVSIQKRVPYLGNFITCLVYIVRDLECRGDYAATELVKQFEKNPVFVVNKTPTGALISLKTSHTFNVTDFDSQYHDCNNDDFNHSFEGLSQIALNSPLVERDLELLKFFKAFVKTFVNRFKGPSPRFSCRVRRSLYFIAHHTPADLGTLTDFMSFKEYYSIIGGHCIVTLKPFNLPDCGFKIYIRDTELLTPGLKGLSAISSLYDDIPKIKLDKHILRNMKEFKKSNPDLFRDYAVRDSEITLFHALKVEASNFIETRNFEIPLTLSSMAAQILFREIGGPLYDLPTKDGRYNIGNLQKLYTPTGLGLSGLGDWLLYFIASYRGGRNEGYGYGILNKEIYDFDLISAYPTALSMLDHPAFEYKTDINNTTGQNLLKTYGLRLIRSYSAFKIEFEFPEGTKFPNFAVRETDSGSVYPLSGETYCTGVELYFAVNTLKCEVKVISGTLIPFLTEIKKEEQEKKKNGWVKDQPAYTSLDEYLLEIIEGKYPKHKRKDGDDVNALPKITDDFLENLKEVSDLILKECKGDRVEVSDSLKTFLSTLNFDFNQLTDLSFKFVDLNNDFNDKSSMKNTKSLKTFLENSKNVERVVVDNPDQSNNSQAVKEVKTFTYVPYDLITLSGETVKEVSSDLKTTNTDKNLCLTNTTNTTDSESENKNEKLYSIGNLTNLVDQKIFQEYCEKQLSIFDTPFSNVIYKLVNERRKHQKGSYNNLLYKFVANSGIGAMGRGLSQKTTFSPATMGQTTIPTGILTNPLYGGWVTSYIRTALTEVMTFYANQNVNDDIVCSCTTDGFLSTIPLIKSKPGIFAEMYSVALQKLGVTDFYIEQKHYDPEGLLNIRTRVQLGGSGAIKAMTGYQNHESKEILVQRVLTGLTSKEREIRFSQFSLRTATDIIKTGGHLSGKYTEKRLNLVFDNKRQILDGPICSYRSTMPLKSGSEFIQLQSFGKMLQPKYSSLSQIPNSTGSSPKDSYTKLCMRQIVRGLLNQQDLFCGAILHNSRSEIVDLTSEIGLKLSHNYISIQKRNPFIPNSVPQVPNTLLIVKRLKIFYPNFDETRFWAR